MSDREPHPDHPTTHPPDREPRPPAPRAGAPSDGPANTGPGRTGSRRGGRDAHVRPSTRARSRPRRDDAPTRPDAVRALPSEAPTQPGDGALSAPGRRPGAPAAGLQRPAVLAGTTATAALRVAATAARWIEEVECGRRPATHLGVLLRPDLAAAWRTVPRQLRRPGTVRRVGRLQIHALARRPSCELVVLVEHGDRALPLGLRLVATADGWVVDDLVRPGSGRRPAAGQDRMHELEASS